MSRSKTADGRRGQLANRDLIGRTHSPHVPGVLYQDVERDGSKLGNLARLRELAEKNAKQAL